MKSMLPENIFDLPRGLKDKFLPDFKVFIK